MRFLFLSLLVVSTANAADDNLGFEKGLKGWKAEGAAFAPFSRPSKTTRPRGEEACRSMRMASIGSVRSKSVRAHRQQLERRKATARPGRSTSDRLKISKPILKFLIGGGANAEKARVELLVIPSEGPDIPKNLSVSGILGAATKKKPGIEKAQVVRIATGANDDSMGWVEWDVNEFKGLDAFIRIVDEGSGEMEHINVDAFQFADATTPMGAVPALSPEAMTEHERYMSMLTPKPGHSCSRAQTSLRRRLLGGFRRISFKRRRSKSRKQNSHR